MHNAEVNQVYGSWEIGDFAVNTSPLFHIAGMMMAMIAIRSGACYLLVPDARDIDYFCRQIVRRSTRPARWRAYPVSDDRRPSASTSGPSSKAVPSSRSSKQ